MLYIWLNHINVQNMPLNNLKFKAVTLWVNLNVKVALKHRKPFYPAVYSQQIHCTIHQRWAKCLPYLTHIDQVSLTRAPLFVKINFEDNSRCKPTDIAEHVEVCTRTSLTWFLFQSSKKKFTSLTNQYQAENTLGHWVGR